MKNKIIFFYLRLIHSSPRNVLSALLCFFLRALSFLYGIVVFLVDRLYAYPIFQHETSLKIVSIGNITWGGTGKTSLILLLAKILAQTQRVCVLTQGYGKDEDFLLRKHLNPLGIDVFSQKDRLRKIKTLEGKYDIVFLDDGFQYRKVKHTVDIVVLNAVEPLGNGFLIPRGQLREPITALKRAHIFFINHSLSKNDLSEQLKPYVSIKPMFQGYYEADFLYDQNNQRYSLGFLSDKPFLAFCAIGYPDGFQQILARNNLHPKHFRAFPDHAHLTHAEFLKLERYCYQEKIRYIVITEKDAYRFRNYSTRLCILVLSVSLFVDRKKEFIDELARLLSL